MIRFVYFLLMISSLSLFSQIQNKIITGATRNEIDTLAFEKMGKFEDEKSGLLEKEIEPDKYIVGPHDKFVISILTSLENIEFESYISPEGLLLLEGAGYVNLKNKSLSESYDLIRTQLKKYYKTDEIYILLKDIRSFKVAVTGNIGKSMTVPATAVDRVSEIIDKTGGAKFDASIRNILLRRNDSVYNVDILKYFLIGDENSNPYVRGGDIIIVPEMDKYSSIGIYGEILNEGDFEFVEGDMLSDLIAFGQGFKSSALKDSIEFSRYDETRKFLEKRIIDLSEFDNFNDIKNSKYDFPLKRGDRIFVRKKPNWDITEYVVLEGEFKYPGKYPIIEGEDSFENVLERAGGFTPNASLENAEFIRQQDVLKKDPEMVRLAKLPPSEMSKSEFRYYQARVREKKGVISINFKSFLTDTILNDDVILFHKDSVIVPRSNEFVNIQGRVNSPGKIKYNPNFTYIDYIESVGGFGYRSDPDETLVTKSQGEIFLAKNMDYQIEPGDVILVPPKDELTFMEIFVESLTILTQLATITGIVLTIVNISR